ncbi:ABR180Wp [Eremothecium gossypii ATCC 10895]|uniref:ABR180Wp n=1 Tax=Eremothecium gossypii (strain ATCC 10895 / CBS 109.51 / FGSC 9923 / NRRL Y-1056) TaxID=284811 RepID=Q75D43_EREGS|nr:ABR180Wp [Eremothecium gossypii ATCC 10895]AAS50952.2 ABR180Wp [Eremothecium gossypii ATCC 10895]
MLEYTELYSFLPYVLLTVSLIIVLDLALWYKAGIWIGGFNPFLLKLSGITVRDRLYVGQVRYHLLRRAVFVGDLKFTSGERVRRGIQRDGSQKIQLRVPESGLLWLEGVLRFFRTLSVTIENSEIEDISVRWMSLDVKYMGDRLAFSVSLQNIKHNKVCLLKSGALEVLGCFTKDSPFGLTCVELSVKFLQLTVPVSNLLALFTLGKEEDEDVEGFARNIFDGMTEDPQLNAQNCVEMMRSRVTTLHSYFSHLTKVDFFVDKVNLADIPPSLLPELSSACEPLKYEVALSSFTFQVTRFSTEQPGYSILFKKSDRPVRVRITLSSLQCALKLNAPKNPSEKASEYIRFFDVPSIILYGDTNIFSERFLTGSTAVSDTIVKLVGHVSSPTIDIEIEKLSILKSLYANIMVLTSMFNKMRSASGKELPTATSRLNALEKKTILSYLTQIIPSVESKITVEDPVIIINDGEDFIFQKCSILSFQTITHKCNLARRRSNAQLGYNFDVNFEILDFDTSHHSKNIGYVNQILKLDSINMKLVSQLIPTLLMSLHFTVDLLKCDLSDLKTLVFLNRIIRKLNSQMLNVEEEYFLQIYQQFASQLEELGKREENTNVIPIDRKLFQHLPSYLDSINLEITDFSLLVGSRSVFLPEDKYVSMLQQSTYDFVNGELRKLHCTFGSAQLVLNNTGRRAMEKGDRTNAGNFESTNGEGFSYDDSGLEAHTTDFGTSDPELWSLSFQCKQVLGTVFSETKRNSDCLVSKTVFKLPTASALFHPQLEAEKLVLELKIDKSEVLVSLMTLFLVFSALQTFKQVFSKEITAHRRFTYAEKYQEYVASTRRKFRPKFDKARLLKLLEFHLEFKHLDMVTVLPNGVKCRFEICTSQSSFADANDISIYGHYFRMCVESPLMNQKWFRMLAIVDFNARLDIRSWKIRRNWDEFKAMEPAVIIENQSCHWQIPHRFEMHRIFDNISTMFKTIKQMVYSLKTCKHSVVVFPTVTAAPELPKITMRSKRLIFSVEDDPFETDLAMIFQIGMQEQRSRLEKYHVFDEWLNTKLQANGNRNARDSDFNERPITPSSATFAQQFASKGIHHPTNDVLEHSTIESVLSQHEYDICLDRYNKLQENISASWIRRVQMCHRKEKKVFKDGFTFLWGKTDSLKLPSTIDKGVIDFVPSPNLMTIIAEGVNIDIFRPSCGLDNTADFIYSVGKGVPKDTRYTLMLPFYIDAKLDELRWHLKDYPLPLVHMPKLLPSQQGSFPAIHLYGDLFITEDMIQSTKELRTIFVPLVPSVTSSEIDLYYSLRFRRSLTPIKIYSQVTMDIHSKDITMVTWGGSYEAAIQQAMNCLDNFSKPPVDPSKKIGFWDKIRNMFHAKINIRWPSEGLFEVSLKGLKDPYAIGGKSAGFVIGLRGNAELKINADNDPKKFLACSADDIYFAIPNYFAKPLLVWCNSSENAVFIPSQNDTNLQRSAAYYYFIDLMPVPNAKMEREIMYRRYIEKSAIKLSGGIIFNIGIVFERLLPGSKDRTFTSLAHYKVRLCDPEHVADPGHDSYRGFRSEFIHLSFTLQSNNSNAYNTMQLTPGVFSVFFSWWSSFSANLPVRRGSLFGVLTKSPKFGDHIHSISYRADIAPFFICHTYQNTDTETYTSEAFDGTLEFVGLKAKMDKFVMDLHQRKEVLHERNKGLDVIKRVMRSKFKEGDVSTFNIDIRTMDAVFKPMAYDGGLNTPEYNIFDGDMTWYDPLDFKEFKYHALDNYVPIVTIGPLLYAPKFVYRKKASYGDKYQVDFNTCERVKPFDNSISHTCCLKPQIEVPLETVEERKDFLLKKRREAQRLLEVATTTNERQHILSELDKLDAVLSKVVELIEAIKNIQNDERADSHNEKTTDEGFKYSIRDFVDRSTGSVSPFENKFFVFCMQLKWDEDARDVIFKYLHLLELSSQAVTLTRSKTLQVIERLCHRKLAYTKSDESIFSSISDIPIDGHDLSTAETSSEEQPKSQSLFELFEEKIYSLNTDAPYMTHDDHFIQFVAPQIQLSTKESPGTCVLVTAPSMKLKIIDFDSNTSDNEYNENVFMTRYTAALIQANVFIFQESDYKVFENSLFNPKGYGAKSTESWQPWLGLELCFEPEPLQTNTVIKEFSSVFKYDRVSSFANVSDLLSDAISMDSVICYLPRFVLASDSKQYIALYNIIANVFVYVEPNSARLKKQVNQLLLGYDPSNLTEYIKIVEKIQRMLVALDVIEEELSFKKYLLDDVGEADLHAIRKSKVESFAKLSIFMKVLTSSNVDEVTEDKKMMFIMKAEEVILHMLKENGEPFLDAALANSYFHRIQSSAGSNSNKIVINMLQVFNLEQDVKFHNLLGPLDKRATVNEKPLIYLEWDMDRPVGGIKVVKNVWTELQGLEFRAEQDTIDNLIRWTMPEMLQELLNNNDDIYGDNDSHASSNSTSSAAVVRDNMFSWALSPIKNPLKLKNSNELHEMVQRSSDYMIIENMVLNSFPLVISYRGHGARRIINVTDFMFTFPKLQFINQTITVGEVLNAIRRVVIKSLLKHTGQFITNKLRKRPHQKQLYIDTTTSSQDDDQKSGQVHTPLKQIQRYKSYTDVNELRQ